MEIRERIDKSPMSRTQMFVVAVCVALNMSDGFDVLAMAFSANSVRLEFDLNGAQLGLLLSAALIGMAIGSVFVSQVADIIGRRATILYCTIVIAVGMILAALAGSFVMLLTLRVITGIAIGTLQACLNVVVAEYSSLKNRPIALSFYTAGQPIGGVLGGIAAGLLLGEFGWRAIFIFGAVLNLLLIPCILRFVPESIDYLVARRPEGALTKINAILVRMNFEPIDEMPKETPKVTVSGRWGKILLGRAFFTTALISAAFFMLMAGFYFANSWTPQLIVTSGFSEANGTLAGTMFSLGGIFGAVFFGPVASRLTVERALAASFLLAAAGFAGFALSIAGLPTALAAAAFLGFITSACMAGLFAAAPNWYPADVRAAAVGFVIGAGRIGAILSPIIVGFLLDGSWTPNSLYYLFTVPMIIGAICILPFTVSKFTDWIRIENRGKEASTIATATASDAPTT